jgi:hypothetical protein
MDTRAWIRRAIVAAAATTSLFVATAARAEDGPRLRGAIAGEGGFFILAKHPTLEMGAAGLHGEIGVQIDDRFAVYALPSVDLYFGSGGLLAFGLAALGDFTISDAFSVGIGPAIESALYAGGGASGAFSFYGGRLHLAYYPVVWRAAGRPRRRALAIGADLKVFANVNFQQGAGSSAALLPMLTLGYQAF